MSMQCNSNLSRAIAIADFILEDEGHTVAEAVKEFHVSKSTIERDLNCLGSVAFYETHRPNSKELKIKYVKVRETLKKLSNSKTVDNISKYNSQRAASK